MHLEPAPAGRFSFWTHAVAATGAVPVLVLLVLQAQDAMAVTTVAI